MYATGASGLVFNVGRYIRSVPKEVQEFGENNDFIRMTKDKIEIMSGKLVEINGGKNRGVLNIAQFESFIQAVAKDLLAAMSGSQVSSWMASEMPKMEDKNFTH